MALIGMDGPAVILDARTCAWLERYADLSRKRVAVRGTDPQISKALEDIRAAAMAWSGSAPTGTTVAPKAEPVRESSYLTTGQAAELAGVTSRAIRKAISEGRLPASKVGSHNRIDREDLNHYLAARAA